MRIPRPAVTLGLGLALAFSVSACDTGPPAGPADRAEPIHGARGGGEVPQELRAAPAPRHDQTLARHDPMVVRPLRPQQAELP